MMWCRRVRGQLSAYIDGELPLDAACRVEAHLATCEGCSRERASIRQLTTLTALIPAEEVPTGLHSRIVSGMTHLRSAPAGPGFSSSFATRAPVRPSLWLGLAGSMVVVLYGVFLNQARVADDSQSLPTGASTFRSMSDPKPNERPAANLRAGVREEGHQAIRALRPTAAHSTATAPAPAAREQRQADSRGAIAPVRADRKRTATSPAGEPRPQPVAANPPPPEYDPGAKPFDLPAPILRTDRDVPGMVGDPVVNAVASSQAESAVSGDKEPTTRMAGMMAESETIGEEDEGLRSLRMFLEERNRMVPQPPALMPRADRRARKSL